MHRAFKRSQEIKHVRFTYSTYDKLHMLALGAYLERAESAPLNSTNSTATVAYIGNISTRGIL